MNDLITACLQRKATGPLVDFPRNLAIGDEVKMIEWIITYETKYGSPPTEEQFIEHFASFVPLPVDGIPLKAIRDKVIEQRLLSIMSIKFSEAQEKIETEKEIPIDLIKEIEQLYATSQGVHKLSTYDRMEYAEEKGITTGFRLIDRVTGGIHPGDYTLIVGRLAAGKTTLALWITHLWWLAGKRILFVSNESLPRDVFAKLDAMSVGFNPLMLRTIDKDELIKLAKKITTKSKGVTGDVIVPQLRLITPSQVGAMALNLGVDAIVIDGVYLMHPDRIHGESKWERVASVSNDLKQMAMDLKRPLLGISQIKRTGDKEEYDPEDIAYSDALGQDADFIMAVKQNKIVEDTAELQLIKNRYGGKIGTRVRFDFDKMKVVEESVESEEVTSTSPETEGGSLW